MNESKILTVGDLVVVNGYSSENAYFNSVEGILKGFVGDSRVSVALKEPPFTIIVHRKQCERAGMPRKRRKPNKKKA